MPRTPFNKQPLNVTQQLNLLEEKGLVIADPGTAEQWLSHISYFRVKQYSYSFKDYQDSDGNYFPGTTLEMVRDLYLFDRKLKMLIFEALENIEIAIKTQLTNTMAAAYGAHWYTDPQYFITEEQRKQMLRNANAGDEIPKAFDHTAFLADIEKTMDDPDEIYLQIYKKMHDPIHPPSWMMVEIITFGTLSLLFENLQPSAHKTSIHEHFGLTKKHFVSWLHCFSFIRNKCAHHARLVYTKIVFAPALPQRKSRQFLAEADDVDNSSLYAVLSCIQHMLSICNNTSSFKKDLVTLIDAYSTIDHDRLGFTKNWKEEALWNTGSN